MLEVVAAVPKLDRFTLWQPNSSLGDVSFGFEFEFASNVEREDFARELRAALGLSPGEVDVWDDYRDSSSSDKDYTIWNIEGDSSIPRKRGQTDIEVVSPPHAISWWERNLQTILRLISKSGETRTGTGSHITFSAPWLSSQSFDPLKFALFINDAHVASSFGRLLNSYSSSFLHAAHQYLTKTYASNKETAGRKFSITPAALIDDVRSNRPSILYRPHRESSINLRKLEEHGLIEIRSPGGLNYDAKGDDLLMICRIIASALKVACSEEYQSVYEYKLAKFLALGISNYIDHSGEKDSGLLDVSKFNIGGREYYVSLKKGGNIVYSASYTSDPLFVVNPTYNDNQFSLDVLDGLNGFVPSKTPYVATLFKRIIKTPVGDFFPGVSEESINRAKTRYADYSLDRSFFEVIGTRSRALVHISPEVEGFISRAFKYSSNLLPDIVKKVLGGEAVPIYQFRLIEDVVDDLAEGRSASTITSTPELVAILPDTVRAYVKGAATSSDSYAYVRALNAISNTTYAKFFPDKMQSDIAGDYVSAISLRARAASLSSPSDLLQLLFEPLSFIGSSELPDGLKQAVSASIHVELDRYLNAASASNLRSVIFLVVHRSLNQRDQLISHMNTLLQYDQLKILIPDVLSNLKLFSTPSNTSEPTKSISNLIWLVDQLPISEEARLSIWRAQASAFNVSQVLSISDSLQSDSLDLLDKWVLATSSTDADPEKAHVDELRVASYLAALLNRSSATYKAYQLLSSMLLLVPDELRESYIRKGFSNLEKQAGVRQPRKHVWETLIAVFEQLPSAIIHAYSDGSDSPGEMDWAQHATSLTTFLADMDTYLSKGSRFWREGKESRLSEVRFVLGYSLSFGDAELRLGAIGSASNSVAQYVGQVASCRFGRQQFSSTLGKRAADVLVDFAEAATQALSRMTAI